MNERTTLTVGSLFAGIGGFDLGLERAGMRSVWQCEIDPYAQRVLAKHWPDVLRVPDIRDVGAGTVPWVDVNRPRGAAYLTETLMALRDSRHAPTFSEWLMGFPTNWTWLDSKQSGTPSSLRSRSGSAGASSSTKKPAMPPESRKTLSSTEEEQPCA